MAVKLETWSREAANIKRSESEDWIGWQISEIVELFQWQVTQNQNQAKGRENILAHTGKDSIVDLWASGTFGSRCSKNCSFLSIFWLYFIILTSFSSRYFFNSGPWQLSSTYGREKLSCQVPMKAWLSLTHIVFHVEPNCSSQVDKLLWLTRTPRTIWTKREIGVLLKDAECCCQ